VLLDDDTMNDGPDHELLQRYADQGAEEAFTALVRRHCDLVWAAARRVSGDGELARDVAQTVFADLARKAGRLPPGTVLAGWLYHAACHAAAKHIRGEIRRAQREQQAMQHQELQSSATAETRAAGELQPVLDAALANLSDTDRDAVVLRFLAGRSLAEVGAALGVNEDAAQKRVSRALEKLREAFRQRGVTVSNGLVAAALGSAGTQAAPTGLAVAVAGGALAGVGATAAATSLLFVVKSKLVFGLVVGAAGVTSLVWQQRNVNRLGHENAALREQLAALPAPAPATVPTAVEGLARLRGEHEELLRLRGQVAQLRQRTNEASAPDTCTASVKPEGQAAAYAAIGAATPTAGLERLMLAARSGDSEGVRTFVSVVRDEGIPDDMAGRMWEAAIRNTTNSFASPRTIRFVNNRIESATRVHARVEWVDKVGKTAQAELGFA